MRKLPTVGLYDQKLQRRRRVGIILLGVTLLVFSPLLYESFLVCVMRWKGLFGQGMRVETPILDAVTTFFTSGRQTVVLQTHSFFHQGTWSSPVVMGFALFWTVVLAMLLRRC